MARRRARQYALQALYLSDQTSKPATKALADLWSTLVDGEGVEGIKPPDSDEVEFAQRLVHGVQGRKAEIDVLIEKCSTNWRLARMPMVDRNILRLAAFELMDCTDIPPNVSINEAVELAKLHGGGDSRAFVNGIVDRMARQLDRIPAHRKR